MSNFDIIPIKGSAFEEIARATAWEADTSRLRVAPNLGWLVTVDEREQVDNLVGFSTEPVGRHGVLLPPANLAEVRDRHQPIEVGLFNTHGAAKGVGTKLASTPQGLQPHSIRGQEIAVCSLPFTSEADMFVRDKSDNPASRAWRLLRHGGLLLVSAALDEMTNSTIGTAWATGVMERPYGRNRLVLMPVPPIWHYQQRSKGVTHTVPPQVVLARGGEFASLNPMTRIGSYPVSALMQEN